MFPGRVPQVPVIVPKRPGPLPSGAGDVFPRRRQRRADCEGCPCDASTAPRTPHRRQYRASTGRRSHRFGGDYDAGIWVARSHHSDSRHSSAYSWDHASSPTLGDTIPERLSMAVTGRDHRPKAHPRLPRGSAWRRLLHADPGPELIRLESLSCSGRDLCRRAKQQVARVTTSRIARRAWRGLECRLSGCRRSSRSSSQPRPLGSCQFLCLRPGSR